MRRFWFWIWLCSQWDVVVCGWVGVLCTSYSLCLVRSRVALSPLFREGPCIGVLNELSIGEDPPLCRNSLFPLFQEELGEHRQLLLGRVDPMPRCWGRGKYGMQRVECLDSRGCEPHSGSVMQIHHDDDDPLAGPCGRAPIRLDPILLSCCPILPPRGGMRESMRHPQCKIDTAPPADIDVRGCL